MATSIWRRGAILLRDRRATGRLLAAPLSVTSRRFSTAARRIVALWGNGDYGRLGLGVLESRWRPTVCSFFGDDDPPETISCGGAHTIFLTQSGRVYATGLNNYGQLGISSQQSHILEPVEVPGIPGKVVQISAGYHHSSAITENGELFIWGNNSNGQLGLGKRAKSIVSTPTRVDFLAGTVVKMVALGSEHSIAITGEHDVVSWGAGGSGRLGHENSSSILGFSLSSSEYTPRLIKNFEGVKVKTVAAGMLHSALIDEQGSVFIFGERTTNKGFGERKNVGSPSNVRELPFSQEVACGGYHTSVVTGEGELYTWGSNENGCLGLGCADMIRSPENVKSDHFKFPVTKVSCGWKHTAAISGGDIFTWGWGGANGTFFEDGHSSGGQLGHGNEIDCFQPMKVIVDHNAKALHVSCGFNHTGGIFEYNET